MSGFRPGGPEDVRGNLIDDPKNTLSREKLTDMGNYNYGYTGAMKCYDLKTLLSIGDYDQWVSGKQGCTLCLPKDRLRDADMIKEGYNDYKAKHPCSCK